MARGPHARAPRRERSRWLRPPAPPAPALLLVDKPAGPTSHDIVAAARRRLPRGIKVGHSGTLDPFATGLLVLMAGRATRLAPFLTGLDKTYLATVRTGFTSASGDTEGPIVPSGPPATAGQMVAVLPGYVGRRAPARPGPVGRQGRGRAPLREGAPRRGGGATCPSATCRSTRCDSSTTSATGSSASRSTAGRAPTSGAWRRTSARPSGPGAYCTALRRTAVGPLSVDDAVAPEEVGLDVGGRPPARPRAHAPPRPVAGRGRRRRARACRSPPRARAPARSRWWRTAG